MSYYNITDVFHSLAATENISTQLHPNNLVAAQKLGLVKRLCPTLSKLSITISGRVPQSGFKDYVSELAALKQLKEVTLVFHTSMDPKYIPNVS